MSSKDLEKKVRKYKELQALIQQLEDETEVLKGEITAEMEARQTDEMMIDVFKVRYTAYQSNRVDTTALKRELPDIAARFSKAVAARRFSIA